MIPPSSPPNRRSSLSKFHLARIVCIAVFSSSTLLNAGALDDYLTNRTVFKDAPWGHNDPPFVTIPIYLKEFSEAKTDQVKAHQVGRLVFLALLMSNIPELRPAVAEMLEKHIMPNIEYTKVYDRTNTYSWHHSILDCKQTYQRLGDHQAVKKCLNTFYLESPLPNDKEMALYLLAYHDVSLKNYAEAVDTINLLPAESKWAAHRPMLIREWTKMKIQAEKKAKEAEKKAKQLPNK